ncbi:hypothetical protein [Mesobacillus jeotgali]|uniref:hypothetical protein n=1 Tax=Mesobacillus jeotgali TaxID=129985 RepID=UPI0009A7E6A0|nr:hypothetical protein [Mesobacillus jeotgali]
MKIVEALIFALIGSILIGSSINVLSPLGNGLIRMLGVIFLINAINIVRRKKHGKQLDKK